MTHLFRILILILLAAIPTAAHAQDRPITPVSEHGQLSVSGPHITDQSDNIISLAGPSFFWSNTGWQQERFYTKGTVATFAKDWNAGIIRVAMGAQGNGSYLDDEDGNIDRVVTVVNAAIKNGLYVIVDWHSHQAEQDIEEAKLFFTALAEAYGETPNLIYEIYNEPLDTTDWDTVVKPYAEELIETIRAVDPDNLIIVGTQSWAQDVDKAADNPITGHANILYALHFYAASHKAELRKKAQYAIDKGLPLIISEWGTVTYNGDGYMDAKSTRKWMEFAKKNNLSHLNWSVSDKNETASMFKPGASSEGGWTDEDLTPSGLLARDIMRDW
ncbi:glycoside hydrolase family 5 protein [Litorimonas sp. WD9-15]|uniref:glycoside hydrolase family 5 protein n=1 Tax=Litorimonas sp. WD9-15 TaxID=3418716 RepID=UPI003D03B97D